MAAIEKRKAGSPVGRRHARGPSLGVIVPITASVLAGLVAWQLVVTYVDIPSYVLPSPSAVWLALVDGLSGSAFSRASFWYHLIDTLKGTLYGFLIGCAVGLALASLMAEFRFVEMAALPYVVGLQSLPKVAIAPLLIIWLGYGLPSKVAMAAMLTVFPVLINSMQGLRSVDRDRLELMISLKATRWQIFRYVKVPSALPMVFAGFNLATVYAMLGTIVAEFIGSQKGMGVIMTQLQTVSDTAGVFAALIVLAATGYCLIVVMRAIQRRVVFWAESGTAGVAP